MQRRTWVALAALAASAFTVPLAFGQGKDIKIAHIYSRTGPLEAYGKQTQTGLMMGLEYATGGTMTVNGRKITFEPAVADSITGDKWNKYIFRTGRNSSQDAISNAAALDKPGITIATLAQDYAFGRDFVKAFKEAIKTAKIVHEEYLPANTTDFTAGAQRLIDKLKDQPGRKVIFINWAGAGNPFKIADLDLKRYGIEIATGGNILPAMAAYKQFPGMEGSTYYYFGIPKNPVNEAMVASHYKQFKSPPDFFTAGGFSAAMAVVTALKKTGGDTSSDKLIAAMEGMSFDTPKGKMTFRKEDHQALQSMYHFKIKVDPAFAWGVPELIHEIKPEEMVIPIRNKR
jgi:branched-chain amino acid transport system substrate-binding protein